MNKVSYFSFAILFIFIIFIMSISKTHIENMRSYAIDLVLPNKRFSDFSKIDTTNSQLALENQLLHSQIEGVYEWLSFEERIDEQVQKFKSLNFSSQGDIYLNDFFRRRSEELKNVLEEQLQSLPAKIIFREPASWSSSVWINVGDNVNESLEKQIIAKNSPVVVGDCLVGIVEYVGKYKSRVRLITDSGLVPSVRVLRGQTQNDFLSKKVKTLLLALQDREDIFSEDDKLDYYTQALQHLLSKIQINDEDLYLAKGELHGCSYPLWRSKNQLLEGIGFNYDFADEEGPSRDLRTGVPVENRLSTGKAVPLISNGDLLVTTGMDGVFPSGLQVATVCEVSPLENGDYYYTIKARPTIENLDELSLVFVMPPLN
jgi:rod shape-determining protein MreC